MSQPTGGQEKQNAAALVDAGMSTHNAGDGDRSPSPAKSAGRKP
jgi:hypothetical protein